jgi:MFS family permease
MIGKLRCPTAHWEDICFIFFEGIIYALNSLSLTELPLSKFTFLSFLAVFELGSLLYATANGSFMFIVGRAVTRMGGAGLVNGCLNTLTVVAPLEKRPTLIGLTFSISTMGSVIGPFIGGALTEKLIWRWCMFSLIIEKPYY